MPEAVADGRLAALLAAELEAPVAAPVRAVADAIRRRHGSASAAVLFYGSCLRRGSTEGVLDFYLLVDGYRSAHASRAVAALNRLLPPNVFYLELPVEGPEPLRAKYAVISTRQFLRRAAPHHFDGRLWARFCQPARLAWARDPAARRSVVTALAVATRTAVEQMRIWLPVRNGAQRFDPAALFPRGFRETYRAELRNEPPEAIDALYGDQAERFDRVAHAALAELEAAGRLRVTKRGATPILAADTGELRRRRLSWRLRRPLAKGLAILGLLKTPATFDGWAGYALWKIERHSGVRVELSERRLRHPMLLGWPILLRLLRRGVLR